MKDIKELTEQAVGWIRTYAEESGMRGAVIGISGGKDSSVVAGLLCKAIGSENVFGVLMPNGVQHDLQDSKDLCDYLGIDYTIYNIETAYNSIANMDITPSKEAMINIAPRLRMNVLYTIGQTMGYRVAGTGNASEAFIGWCTKWGDMACDFNVLANFNCHQVMLIGKELGLPEHLWNKKPADGLTGRSDEDNFGFSYEDLHRVMECEHGVEEDLLERVYKMHNASRHKFVRIPTFNPNK